MAVCLPVGQMTDKCVSCFDLLCLGCVSNTRSIKESCAACMLFLQVLLWAYPDVDRSPLALQTDHAANIFGVQFLPCTNSRQVITGAMDDTVMLHNIERLPAPLSRRGSGSAQPVPFQSTLYGCHKARVKVITLFCMFQSLCARQSAVHA